MAYYTALINAWNSVQQPPAGVSGTALSSGMSTQQKLNAVNAWTVPNPQKAILTPSQILNAVQTTDFNSLTVTQLQQLTLLLQGQSVDASVGTQVRGTIQSMFSGKTTTLNALAALVAPYDNATQNWCFANGYPGSPAGPGNLSLNDTTVAGLS